MEISSAYNCAHLEITNEPRPDHAQYVAHWLEILKGDKKAIFAAASLASQIVTYLDGLQPKNSQALPSNIAAPSPERPDSETATDAAPKKAMP